MQFVYSFVSTIYRRQNVNDGEVINLNLWKQENLEWDGSHFSAETNLFL